MHNIMLTLRCLDARLYNIHLILDDGSVHYKRLAGFSVSDRRLSLQILHCGLV